MSIERAEKAIKGMEHELSAYGKKTEVTAAQIRRAKRLLEAAYRAETKARLAGEKVIEYIEKSGNRAFLYR